MLMFQKGLFQPQLMWASLNLNITAYWTVICDNPRCDGQQKWTYAYSTQTHTQSYADFFVFNLSYFRTGKSTKVIDKI